MNFLLTREHGCPHREIEIEADSEDDLRDKIEREVIPPISRACAESAAYTAWRGNKARYGNCWTVTPT